MTTVSDRYRSRLSVTLLVLPLAGLALLACSEEGDSVTGSDEEQANVTVETFTFAPDPLVVDAGTTITFRNEDAIDHTVTAGAREQPDTALFDGSLPGRGATFEIRLDEAGTYDYFCQIHPGPGMTASITVE